MSKEKRKQISLFMLLAMLLMILSGCTSTDVSSEAEAFDPEKEALIKVWHSWTDQEEQALIKATEMFKDQYPNISFSLLYTPNDNYKDKLKASLQTGDGPDLFFGPHDWTGEFAVGNLIDPIDDYVKEQKQDYIESTYQAAAFNNKHYAFPLSMETVVLIYNKDIVQTPPTTISELTALTKEYTAGDQWGLVIDLNNTFYNTYGFFSGFGGSIFKDDQGTPNFNNQAFVDYLDFLDQLKNKDRVIPQQLDYGTAQALFVEGKAAFYINGPWIFGHLDSEGVNWAATTIPKNDLTGKESKPFMGIKVAYLPRTSSSKGAAAEFAKFMASAEITGLFNEMVGTIPANNKVEQLSRWSDELIQQQAASAEAMPAIPEMGQVWNPVKDAINAVLDGNQAPEAIAEKVQNEVEKAIQEAKGE
ncbi:sugar ABC transporter substrate-binding protein [Alkaliphilus crotonatoxidans]